MDAAGYIDFHCHLDDPGFALERDDLVARCRAAGFSRLVTVADAYDEASLDATAELLSRHDLVAATVGAHPHHAHGYAPQVEKRLLAFLDRQRVLALGEVGLDFHYDLSPRDRQEQVFRRQAAIAAERGLPLVIHSREAERRVLDILEQERFPGPVVFHCFTGDEHAAAEILDRGYSLSFSGIITFRKAEALRRVVAATPLERLLSETDSPYLAPEPERGRRNTPLGVVRVVERIAAIKGIAEPEVLAQVAANLRRLQG
jgi:TatD DNase family protein